MAYPQDWEPTEGQTALETAAQAKQAADTAKAAADTAQVQANAAADAAESAAGLAAEKSTTLIQGSPPDVKWQTGDTLWIDTTGGANTPKRWDGSAWVAITDKQATDAAAQAVAAKTAADAADAKAADAQSAADNAQAAADSAASAAQDAQSTADGAQSAANAAQAAASSAQDAADAAKTAADAAQSTADAANADVLALAGKTGKVIHQESAPAGSNASANNLWIKDSTGQPYTYDGSQWELVTDSRIMAAASKADAAQDTADGAQAAAEAAQQAADSVGGDLTEFIGAMNSTVDDLQSQIDGSITTWFYPTAPTTSNAPASGWVTTDDKNNHLGDLYYDTISGYCYRWQVISQTYSWQRITDTDVTKALSDAAAAQDTADSKRRVFAAQPTPPYDVGDLWAQGSTGDLMRCKTAKASGQSYLSTDWEKASKYTDDAAALAAQQAAEEAQQAATAAQTFRCASNTAQATAAKVPASTVADFTLAVGAVVSCKFTYANTASAPTFSVNGSGAKAIMLNGSNSVYWQAGANVTMIYDGTYWQIIVPALYGATSVIGNPGAGNVLTDSGGVSLRQGTSVLASIKAALIELGVNSANAIIKLCGGMGRLGYDTTSQQMYFAGPLGSSLHYLDGENMSEAGIGILKTSDTSTKGFYSASVHDFQGALDGNSGTITAQYPADWTIQAARVVRIGNLVIASIDATYKSPTTLPAVEIFTVPTGFRPKTATSFSGCWAAADAHPAFVEFQPGGVVKVWATDTAQRLAVTGVWFA